MSQEEEEESARFKLSRKVEEALEEIFHSEEKNEVSDQIRSSEFCSSKFSSSEYISKMFPTENSLKKLDGVLVLIRRQMERIRHELHQGIRDQSLTEHETETINLEKSKETIELLFTKIQSIQQKATQSEALVEQITKDVQKLDDGKRNLQHCISSLTKLRMFTSSIDQLKGFVEVKKYKETAIQLRAISSFVHFFQEHAKIDKIAKLFKHVLDLKSLLTRSIGKEFSTNIKTLRTVQNELKNDPDNVNLKKEKGRVFKQLNHICLVIDALSEKEIFQLDVITNSITSGIHQTSIRDEVIQEFVQKEMVKYVRQSKDLGLDKIGKRFKFLRRLLAKNRKAFNKIFPKHWCIEQELVVSFSIITHEAISKYLLRENQDVQPKILINAIKASIWFEREMRKNYHSESDWEIEKRMKKNKLEIKKLQEKKADIRKNSTQRIGEVYQLITKIQELEKQNSQYAKELEQHKGKEDQFRKEKKRQTKKYHFLGLVSKVFEPHMNKYLNYEATIMVEKIGDILKREKWDPLGHNCGEDLFIFLEESMKNCIAFTKGKTLYKLYCEVWKRHVLTFISRLLEKIPVVKIKQPHLTFKLISSNSSLSSKNIKKLCQIVNIASYCRTELSSFKRILSHNIIKDYQKKIDFKEEKQKFYHLEKKAINQLVKNLINLANNELSVMTKIKWGSWTKLASDQNEYIQKAYNVIQTEILKFVNYLHWESYKLLCNFFVISIRQEFENHIFKCKKISLQGCDQFNLDVATFSDYMRKIITFHKEFEDYDEYKTIFIQKVNETFKSLSAMFKVLRAPKETIVETYKQLFSKSQRSNEHFEKIVDLKYVEKEEEKNSLLDKIAKMGGNFVEQTTKLIKKKKTSN